MLLCRFQDLVVLRAWALIQQASSLLKTNGGGPSGPPPKGTTYHMELNLWDSPPLVFRLEEASWIQTWKVFTNLKKPSCLLFSNDSYYFTFAGCKFLTIKQKLCAHVRVCFLVRKLLLDYKKLSNQTLHRPLKVLIYITHYHVLLLPGRNRLKWPTGSIYTLFKRTVSFFISQQ